MITTYVARMFSAEIREAHEQTQTAIRDLQAEQARAWELERRGEQLTELLGDARRQRDELEVMVVRLRREARRPPAERLEGRWLSRSELIRVAHHEQLAEHWRAQYEELRGRIPAGLLADIDRAMRSGL